MSFGLRRSILEMMTAAFIDTPLDLLGTSPHLSTFASEPAGALFLPLLSHGVLSYERC
ncbi:hypothetical protein BDP27DRAFT_1330485 [Rhodocollybia butyracea]|uniref:Uncharacterized protein n=1 Tax=Rhodocollybia butyracea TaxID=206335 RepID=A0A9P5PN69_9AGAR|nr:hypothetical protein BDP27DRAFT_1330485 [Rhodocollybia butyracea]